MISVISPVYNEAENLPELCERVTKAFDNIDEDFELVLVENGSVDGSLEIIKNLRQHDSRIKFVSLSRNFGHQGGLIAGLAHASGDAVISIDGDLQHPPELIPKMIQRWKDGFDVVYTTKKDINLSKDWKFFPTKWFYRGLSYISDIELAYGQSDFRLLDRRLVDILFQIPEKNKFLRGMVEWMGFSQTGIEYELKERTRGTSKFPFWHYINFALDGIFSFSTIPLRLFLWLGLIIACGCAFYAIYWSTIGIIYLYFPDTVQLPPGWATIAVSVSFLGGVQLIGIGCLGEYIGRIYHQSKERPDFIVKEKALE